MKINNFEIGVQSLSIQIFFYLISSHTFSSEWNILNKSYRIKNKAVSYRKVLKLFLLFE